MGCNALGNMSTINDTGVNRPNAIKDDERAKFIRFQGIADVRRQNLGEQQTQRTNVLEHVGKRLSRAHEVESAHLLGPPREESPLERNGGNTPHVSSKHQTTVNTSHSGADTLTMTQQIYKDRSRQNPTTLQTRITSQQSHRIAIDLISPDPSPPRLIRKPPSIERAKSFNAEPLISGPPKFSSLSPRSALRRASTLPIMPLAPMYGEISDDDDDLRAAIAASLADMSTPKPAAPQTTSYAQPDSMFRSSPPSPKPRPIRSTTSFIHPEDLLRSSPPPSRGSVAGSTSQRSAHAAPSSQNSDPPSSQIRDDTRRMLLALDEVTANIMREKHDPAAAKSKKASKRQTEEENEGTSKRKKRAISQREKVHSLRTLRANNRTHVSHLSRKSKQLGRRNVVTR